MLVLYKAVINSLDSSDACCVPFAELVFQQLVQVLTALLAATFPGSAPGIGTSTSSSAGASSSSSSSRPGVPLQQLAAFALAWEQMCGFMTSFGLASDPVSVDCE